MLAQVAEWALEKVMELLVRWWVLVFVGAGFGVAALLTGDPAWAIGTIAIPVGLLVRQLSGRERAARALLRKGDARWAQLVGVRETHESADEHGSDPVMQLALRLDGPGDHRLGIRQTVRVPRRALVLGTWLPVRVDRGAPWKAIVDWGAAATHLGVPSGDGQTSWRPLRDAPPEGFTSSPDDAAPTLARVLAAGAWIGVAAFLVGGVVAGGVDGVALVAAGVLVALPAAVIMTIWARRAGRRARLLARPDRTPATVLDVKTTNSSMNDRRVLKLDLRVDHAGGSQQVSVRRSVPDPALHAVVAGTVLPVAVDPRRLRELAVDWPRFLGTVH